MTITEWDDEFTHRAGRIDSLHAEQRDKFAAQARGDTVDTMDFAEIGVELTAAWADLRDHSRQYPVGRKGEA